MLHAGCCQAWFRKHKVGGLPMLVLPAQLLLF